MTHLKYAILLLLTLIVMRQDDSCRAQPTLVIRGGHVFDTESGTFHQNVGLAVSGDRIFSQEYPAEDISTAQKIVLDDDQYILPGLFDLHAHYNVKLVAKRREEFHVMPIVYLANGVTATFSAGEYDPEGMDALRRSILAGEQIGPMLLTSGPYFGRVRPGWRTITHEQIAADVAYWTRRGAAGFKAKAIGPEHLKTLIKEAHQHGRTVTGHLGSGYRGSVNPRDAIHMGIDRIEHFLGGDAMTDQKSAYATLASITPDTPGFRETVELYVETGTWFDCTITAYGYFGLRGEEYDDWGEERKFFTPFIQKRVEERPQQVMQQFEDIYQAKLKTIGEFHRLGGKITLGTDHFSSGEFLPGFGAHRELNALVRGGISPADAIRIATINGARAMGLDADYGSIEHGKVADMFIVRGNPLDNIRNSRNVEIVIRAGTVHHSQELLTSVRGLLGPKDESESMDW